MAEDMRPTVHSMPTATLRARMREAHRIVERALTLARASFERNGAPDAAREQQVGAMLDALEHLLPGVGLLAVQRASEAGAGVRSSLTVSTPRERTREQIERAALIAGLVDATARLLAEIERARVSAVVRVADSPSSAKMPHAGGVGRWRRS